MVISYDAIAIYGKYFNDTDGIREYVEAAYPGQDFEFDDECITGIPALDEIEVKCLNYMTGDGYMLGYSMCLGELIDDYKAKWDQAFPGKADEADAVLEVVCC